MPDGTKLERKDNLTHELKAAGLPLTYRKKPPSERSKNYAKYHEAVRRASEADSRATVIAASVGAGSTAPYSVVDEPDAASRLLRQLRERPFAFDYETTNVDPRLARVVGLALADEKHSWYIHGRGLQALPELEATLRANPNNAASNIKYEYEVSYTNFGMVPTSVCPGFDTQVAHWILAAGGPDQFNNDLKWQAKNILHRNVLKFEDVVPKGASIEDIPVELLAKYAAAGDARNSFDLVPELIRMLEKEIVPTFTGETNLLAVYESIERPLTPVLAEMELAGCPIDLRRMEEIIPDIQARIDEIVGELVAMGFRGRLSAGEDVARWFYEELGLPKYAVTATGRGKLDVPTLDRIRDMHPAVDLYTEWNKLTKLKGTFIEPHIAAGTTHIYHTLSQTSTGTGRLSSKNPNMQNWPLKMRECVAITDEFLASRGLTRETAMGIWARDYSQIEPRIAAVASHDPVMLYPYTQAPYLDDAHEIANVNADPYIQIGLKVPGLDKERILSKEKKMRTMLKALYLGTMYGAGAKKFKETVNKAGYPLSLSEAADIQREADDALEFYKQYKVDTPNRARRAGGAAYSLNGRRRLIPKLFYKDPEQRSAAEREAINMGPQGTGADIIKLAMVKVQALCHKLGPGRTLFNQVHDELVGMWTEDEERMLGEIVDQMMQEHPYIPLRVEGGFGRNWLEAKPK